MPEVKSEFKSLIKELKDFRPEANRRNSKSVFNENN